MKRILKIVLYVFLGIIGITIIGALFTPSSAAESSETSVLNDESETTMEWVMVKEVKSSGRKTSAPFTLGNGDKKVLYAYKSNNNMMGMFSYYIVPKGTNVMKEGGIPEVMVSEIKVKDESYLNRDAGEYQIVTNCAGNFVIQVWEMQPVPKEKMPTE